MVMNHDNEAMPVSKANLYFTTFIGKSDFNILT